VPACQRSIALDTFGGPSNAPAREHVYVCAAAIAQARPRVREGALTANSPALSLSSHLPAPLAICLLAHEALFLRCQNFTYSARRPKLPWGLGLTLKRRYGLTVQQSGDRGNGQKSTKVGRENALGTDWELSAREPSEYKAANDQGVVLEQDSNGVNNVVSIQVETTAVK